MPIDHPSLNSRPLHIFPTNAPSTLSYIQISTMGSSHSSSEGSAPTTLVRLLRTQISTFSPACLFIPRCPCFYQEIRVVDIRVTGLGPRQRWRRPKLDHQFAFLTKVRLSQKVLGSKNAHLSVLARAHIDHPNEIVRNETRLVGARLHLTRGGDDIFRSFDLPLWLHSHSNVQSFPLYRYLHAKC